MAHGKTKDLVKRTQSDKVLKNKAFKICNTYVKRVIQNMVVIKED